MNTAATTIAITEFFLEIMAPLLGDPVARAMPPPLTAVSC
jgi:hypothetical protein